jgi:hypothetical protein
VPATGTKVRGFQPGRGDGFLSSKKIRNTLSFGEELKPSTPNRFYGMVKNPAEYDRDTTSTKFKDIYRQLPASPLDVSAATTESLWMNQE